MDPNTGHIYTKEQVAEMSAERRAQLVEMNIDPSDVQLKSGRVGRNDPCPCGSGSKFKACCLREKE